MRAFACSGSTPHLSDTVAMRLSWFTFLPRTATPGPRISVSEPNVVSSCADMAGMGALRATRSSVKVASCAVAVFPAGAVFAAGFDALHDDLTGIRPAHLDRISLVRVVVDRHGPTRRLLLAEVLGNSLGPDADADDLAVGDDHFALRNGGGVSLWADG